MQPPGGSWSCHRSPRQGHPRQLVPRFGAAENLRTSEPDQEIRRDSRSGSHAAVDPRGPDPGRRPPSAGRPGRGGRAALRPADGLRTGPRRQEIRAQGGHRAGLPVPGPSHPEGDVAGPGLGRGCRGGAGTARDVASARRVARRWSGTRSPSLEGVMAGEYYIIDRWGPSAGADYTELCRYMLDLSGLDVMETWKRYRD
jgi:hypothetical protein